MNRKALYGILIAVLIPIIGYIYVKRSSDSAVIMPRHYIYDTIVSGTKNGKSYNDTVWHSMPDFQLTNQLGQKISWKDTERSDADGKKEGKIVVANFFFTHCPNICITMTQAMKMLQDGIKSSEKVGTREADFIQFLSFSIDPERDSVPELKKWSDRFQINPQSWWLLTGDRKTIYDLSYKHMALGMQPGGPADTNFAHSSLFVLLDKNRLVRGYYHVLNEDNGIDTAVVARLSEDIVLLSLEKDAGRKSFLAGKLELLAIVFAIAAIGVIGLIFFLRREKRP